MQRLIYIFLVFCTLFSCSPEGRKAPDVSGISVNVPVERLEDEMMACRSEADVRAFLARHPGFRRAFLGADSVGTDVLSGQVYQLVTNAAIKNLYNETRRAFGDFSEVRAGFTDAFRHIKHYYPDFKIPKVQTAISGLGTLSKGQDLLVTDSLIVVSLDFYIGPKASYVPDVPQYVLRRYRKEFIVPSVVLLLSQRYNRTSPTDQSLLTEMVYYGKAFEFAKDVQPNLPDSLATGHLFPAATGRNRGEPRGGMGALRERKAALRNQPLQKGQVHRGAALHGRDRRQVPRRHWPLAGLGNREEIPPRTPRRVAARTDERRPYATHLRRVAV
jgi:hypothetical protein